MVTAINMVATVGLHCIKIINAYTYPKETYCLDGGEGGILMSLQKLNRNGKDLKNWLQRKKNKEFQQGRKGQTKKQEERKVGIVQLIYKCGHSPHKSKTISAFWAEREEEFSCYKNIHEGRIREDKNEFWLCIQKKTPQQFCILQ